MQMFKQKILIIETCSLTRGNSNPNFVSLWNAIPTSQEHPLHNQSPYCT